MLQSHLLIGMDLADLAALFVSHDNNEIHIALLGNDIAFLNKVFGATVFGNILGIFTLALDVA